MTYSQKLADGLTLRALSRERDKENFAAFSARFNNEAEGATCTVLTQQHPEMTPDDFWIVEADATQDIVSTTCLIPWTLRFAGIELRAAQLEMVLTHPAYRRGGLVRTQMRHFEEEVVRRGCDLSFIWGIPYYYRQYGYAYTIDGATEEMLPAWRIPYVAETNGATIRLRPAVLADVPALVDFYDREFGRQDLAARRSAAYWRYLLVAAHHPIEMIENAATGEALGYAIVSRSADSATIIENALPDAMTALAVLQALDSPATKKVLVKWPRNNVLAALAQQLGSQTNRGGQWLVRVPDLAQFLVKMRPVFEKRLAESAWRGVSISLTINLYREAFRLCFTQGQLAQVEAPGFVDASMGTTGNDLCIPPDAFMRLLFGFRALDDLFDAWPDLEVKPEARPIIQALFPQLQPFLHTPYHDLGAVV